MHEGICDVGDSRKIKAHRLDPVPDAFDAQGSELVSQVTIGEEIAEFTRHLEFEFHGFEEVQAALPAAV